MLVRVLLSGILVVALLPAADTRVADAALRGDRAAVQTLLRQKADANGAQGDGATALHWAAFKGDTEMAKMLLAAGASVKATTREGAITPLFMACTSGDAAMIEILLKAGADANSVNANGTTALMTAAASGSADAVKTLLDRGADANAVEYTRGQTALMFAAAMNRDAAIRVLLARGARPDLITTVKKVELVRFDQDGGIVEDKPVQKGQPTDEEAVAKAAAEAQEKARNTAKVDLDAFARALQLKMADYKEAKPKTRAGDISFRAPQRVGPEASGAMSALHYAAREGNMEAARALVEGGAALDPQNADKYTPMLTAITNGHLDLGNYLLERGANPNTPAVTGLTALYATIDIKWAPKSWVPQPIVDGEKITYLDLMKNLLDHGANVNGHVNERSWFRTFGGGVGWVDEGGATAFWRAAQALDLPAMKFLLARGADPKLATKGGATPLMVAAGVGWGANWTVDAPFDRKEVVTYLVGLGSDVNAADSRGYTSLHGAAYLGNNDLVTYLVGLGARVEAKSKAGDTVADMANGPSRFGMPHPETVALLEKLGSANSHNCRSDQCVVAANAGGYAFREQPLTPAEEADKAALNTFAVSLGFKEAEYHNDAPAPAFGRGGLGGRTVSPGVPPVDTAKTPPPR